jgi:predicted ester cyclase
MGSSAAETVVTEQIRLLNEGDTAGSAATFADHVLNHGREVTRDGVEAVLRSLRMAMPDLHSETVEMVSDGEVVVCRSVLTGTHLGTPEIPFVQGGVFAMVEPSGKRIEMMQMHWFRVRDGKIIEHWAVRDDLTMARQLGVVADPFASPERA